MTETSNLIPLYQNFKNKEEAFHTINLLRNVVDTMSNYFLIWDQDDRLVVCNEKIFELFPGTQDIYVVGRSFEETLRMGFERGDFEVPEKMTTEEWIQHRVTLHKRGEYVEVRKIKDHWFQIRDQKTADGYIVVTAIDITYLKKQEKELEITKERAIQAEEHLRDALDTMSDGFTLWNKDDQLIVGNKRLSELYANARDIYTPGRTFEETSRMVLEKGDFKAPDGADGEEWVQERIDAHKSGNYQATRRVKGRWLQIKDQRTAQGNTVTTAVDITSLKEKEQQLEAALKEAEKARKQAAQAESLLRDALDAMPGSFTLWDKNDQLIVCNERVLKRHPNMKNVYTPGRPFEEMFKVGLKKGNFTVPKGQPKEKWIKRRIAEHKSGEYEEVRHVKGRWLHIRDQLTSQGNHIITSMDVTSLKEKEQQLKTALKEAELARKQAETARKNTNQALKETKQAHRETQEALREAKIARAQAEKATEAKSRFLNMMSHEIRTPLQGVVNMSQLLMTSIVEPDQHDKLTTILRSSESLLTILNDALDIAKVEAGKLPTTITTFDLKKLVEGIMIMYTLPIQEKNISFTYSLDPNLPRFLEGDAGKIRQILFNFIDNALKFTPDNGKISVHCEARPSSAPLGVSQDRPQDKSSDKPSNNEICLEEPAEPRQVKLYMSVTDTGIGINKEAQQSLFVEEFNQADETIAQRFGGCGLGLSICKKVIDSLKGEIGVKSKPDQGSTFWVTIDGLKETEHHASINWYYGHKEHTKLPSQRILFVEDNVLNQKSTGEVLQHLDHKVTVVPDGVEALRELKDKDFDLVITDLQMPRLNGLDLIHSIRALPGPKKDVPVFVLTARAAEGDAKACLEAGVTRHIAKPITMWELQKIMAEVLGYHQETDKTKKEAKRNTYYQEQDQSDDLQLIAIDQSVLKVLRSSLSDDEILEIIDDYEQTVEKNFNKTLLKVIKQGNYAKARDIVRDFRCMSGTLGLNRLVERLKKLKTALQNEEQDRIYDYYHQAKEEIESTLPILKGFFKAREQETEDKKQKEVDLLVPSAIDKEAFRGIKTLYVFSKDQTLKSELQDQLSHYGYKVNTCTTFKKLQTILPKKEPFLLMMDLDKVSNSDEIAKFCQERQEAHKNCYYIMMSSSEDDLTIRRKAVQLGARDFYAKPVDYSSLVDKLDNLTSVDTSEPYRVLIVDDDPVITKYHSFSLKKAGMVTRAITDPLACIDTLYEFRPDIILMDINMPECNGVELSYIIRQHQAFVGIPITFLSGEQDYAKHVAALQGGGDDFLKKPIDPSRLIEAVTLRVERLRKLRSYMIRDSLTGLLNHSNIQENLARQALLAEREEHPLSFALIDIDKFKSVNDTYGHPVGDRVIKTLSRYLKQHLRRTDIIGRYGGEEFAIILPNTSGKKAKDVIDKIREGFGSLGHPVDKQKTIQVTFSVGIATYPEIKEWSDLIKTADEQLYEAKKQGRNCAVLYEGKKD